MNNILEGLAAQGMKPVDDLPAQLTENEFVIPADVVIALGNGDPKEGFRFFDDIIKRVRAKTQRGLSAMRTK